MGKGVRSSGCQSLLPAEQDLAGYRTFVIIFKSVPSIPIVVSGRLVAIPFRRLVASVHTEPTMPEFETDASLVLQMLRVVIHETQA